MNMRWNNISNKTSIQVLQTTLQYLHKETYNLLLQISVTITYRKLQLYDLSITTKWHYNPEYLQTHIGRSYNLWSVGYNLLDINDSVFIHFQSRTMNVVSSYKIKEFFQQHLKKYVITEKYTIHTLLLNPTPWILLIRNLAW